MRAKVVHEPGMKPNCAGSMADSTTGFNALSMTKPSATFDRVDVSEIGLRSLLMSLTVGALGRGGTSASFHARGTLHSKKDVFRMSAIGAAKISAYSRIRKMSRVSSERNWVCGETVWSTFS